MSSPGVHPPRAAVHSHGKRPFEECSGGCDPDPPSSAMPAASGSDTRNKRARSTSSASAGSSPASSSGYTTAPSADAPAPALRLPMPPPRTLAPSPPAPEDALRTSLERFAEFDRQIAALRTSLAATPPPDPPPTHPRLPALEDPAPLDARVPRGRRSMSPLVFSPDPASTPPSADMLLRYRPVYGDRDSDDGRSLSRPADSPAPLSTRPPRLSSDLSLERAPVRSVFDVFDIGEPSRPYPAPVPPRVLGSHNESPRGPASTTAAPNVSQTPRDVYLRHRPSWSSIPSSNSLMSESASERRHALAMERFHARTRRSSFDADDESDSRWSGSSGGRDLGIASPAPPSPSVESVPPTTTSSHFPAPSAMHAPPSTTNRITSMTSLQRSFSEFLAETQTATRDTRANDWVSDWERHLLEQERERERDRQRERTWEWERERGRQRERSSQDVQSRGFPSGSSLASTSSAREESSYPSRPSLGQLGAGPNTTTPNLTAAATNNHQQYSYSNLNLATFQSGLFRDSLRRNAEVDQTSFPPIPLVTPGESRGASGFTFEDSGSDMDSDDLVEPRLRYAGHTPPHTPPRNTSPLPGFSVLRRGSHESQGHSQPPNRNSMMFARPTPSVLSRPARPTSYESSHRPAPPERTERDRFLPARILESFYRSNEDGRRNVSAANRQPYHPQHPAHPSHSLTSGPNDVGGLRGASGSGNRPATEAGGENRRGSLGLGGSLRSRLARFANPQSSSNASDVSSTSRQRSPSHPIGARPQVVEHHRRGSLSVFGGANVQETRPSVSGPPPHWAMNPGTVEPVAAREVPWRASSGPRSAFAPPPPAGGPTRADAPDATRADEQRSRLRTLRQRLQLDRSGEGTRVFRPGMLRAAIGRRGNLGDYVPDELFDDSYEALLSLSSMLGDVRSRVTPEEVISSLPTGTFKEWKKDDSETRCPICLDDYEPSDVVTKLVECTHWLHKNCLEQWLRTANTCPVCREKVQASPKPAPARRRPHRDMPASSETNHGTNSLGNGPNSRPPHTGPQSNNGRPASFAAMVFDRLMNDGGAQPGSSSSSQVSQPPRDPRTVFLERLRAQQQQQQPQVLYEHHDAYVPFPPPHDPVAYRPRAPPTNPVGPSPSRPTTTAGPDVRSFGFASLLRHGTDMNMVVDDGVSRPDSNGRRPGGTGAAGMVPGSSFLDLPTNPRRENVFSFVPAAPLPTQQQQHVNAPATMPEGPRDWRNRRMYDALVSVEASRSASSSSSSSFASTPSSRPVSMANRIPVEEEGAFEEYVFGWSMRRGQMYRGDGASSGA